MSSVKITPIPTASEGLKMPRMFSLQSRVSVEPCVDDFGAFASEDSSCSTANSGPRSSNECHFVVESCHLQGRFQQAGEQRLRWFFICPSTLRDGDADPATISADASRSALPLAPISIPSTIRPLRSSIRTCPGLA